MNENQTDKLKKEAELIKELLEHLNKLPHQFLRDSILFDTLPLLLEISKIDLEVIIRVKIGVENVIYSFAKASEDAKKCLNKLEAMKCQSS